jgi:hypothetical protein
MAGGELDGMKVLVVAHPDDECIWFAPEQYDRIVIVHTGRLDDPGQSERRARAVVSVASSFACLASVFQKRQLILSYTEDVSFWPHNPNAIKLAMPTQAEAQAVIDEEGF